MSKSHVLNVVLVIICCALTVLTIVSANELKDRDKKIESLNTYSTRLSSQKDEMHRQLGQALSEYEILSGQAQRYVTPRCSIQTSVWDHSPFLSCS